jgi:hypothetical protein
MTKHPTNTEPHDEGEIDAGTPIEILATFEHEPSADLLSRISRSIHRRTLVSQFASFSWNTPLIVLMEFWGAFADQLFPKSTRKERQR